MSLSTIMASLRAVWREGLRPGSAAAYGLAIGCAALATGLRFALGLIHPDVVPFATYFPAVLLVTFLAGATAGAFALLLGAVLSWWLFMSPNHASLPLSVGDAINLVVFLCVGALIVWTAEALRRKRRQLTLTVDAAGEFAAIVAHSGDAIVGFGMDSRVRSWNTGAERLFGYRADEIIGQPLSVLVPPEKQDEPNRLFPRSSSGEFLYFDTQRMTKDGRRINVSVSTGPIRSATGKITGVSAIFRDITDRKKREEHLTFVMRELSHRAKNLLAVIQAIARQTGRQTASVEDFEQRFIARLQALAHSHDVLLRQEWRGGTFDDLIKSQLMPFAEVSSRVTTSGPDLLLPPRAVEQIGIALHELATNAVKHGALSLTGGSVKVEWAIEPTSDGKVLRVAWSEHGGPPVSPPSHEGFGHAVVKRLVPIALNGSATLDFPVEGIRWTLVVPAADIIQLGPGGSS